MSRNHIVKSVRLTKHAREQSLERGTTQSEIEEAIRKGSRQPAKQGRELCRYNFSYGKTWQGKSYAVKQVAPVIKEEKTGEIVVVTVYTFYF